MFALLFFASTLFFGYALLRLLPLKVSRTEQAALSVVFGILASSWVLFLVGWRINLPVAMVVTIAIQVLAILSCKFLPLRLTTTKAVLLSPVWQFATQFASALVVLFLLYLCYTHTLQIFPDGWYSSGYTWSDTPLHMSLISGVAYRHTFDFQLPVYYTAKLSYPFLIDVYSGALLRVGGVWQLALFLPTAALLLSLVQLMLSVSYRLLGSIRAAWMHLALFIFSGSFWGMILFFQDLPKYGFLAYQLKDYSNLEDQEHLFFANIVTSHLFPQRGFLFGFVIALAVLFFLHQAWQKAQVPIFVALGILVGLLPFAHVYTFFIMVGLLGSLTLHDVWKRRNLRSPWLLAFGIALLLSAPQMWWQFSSAYHANFGRWFLGWARGQGESALVFWLRNWGLLFLFLFGNFWVLLRNLRENKLVWHIYLISVLIFLAVNVRIFQPNVFDNMKFLVYGFWGVTLVTSYALARWSRHRWGAFVAILILVASCFTGVLTLARESGLRYQEFSSEELTFAEDFRQLVPPDAHLLTSSRHNHPVPALTGREILMGYPGWLWSYGIDVSQTLADTGVIFAGQPQATPLLHHYGVTHVVFNSTEISELGINLPYFQKNHDLIYTKNGWFIFAVR